jgi:hypothetical protein
MTEHSPTSPTATHIIETLGETDAQPCEQIHGIVAVLGEEAATALLAEVQQIEANGGMLLPDGSRRRTPGGVFFHLAYHKLSPDDQKDIYYYKQRPRSTLPPPLKWKDRGEWIAEARSDISEATTVKITLIGALRKTVEKQGFTLGMLTHTPRLDSLPKGVPRPRPTATTYIVYIGNKQWRKVKDALRNPEDVAIIEGVPMWDTEYEAMTVFATSVTTKLTQQAKREAQRAQAGAGE